MHKMAVMAAVMISALGGQSIAGRSRFVEKQTEEQKEFYINRAAAKRARRATPSSAIAKFEPVNVEKSRQVERAEFRREVKRGNHIRKQKDRTARALNRPDSRPSLLRIAAMNAVSTLSGFGAKRKAS